MFSTSEDIKRSFLSCVFADKPNSFNKHALIYWFCVIKSFIKLLVPLVTGFTFRDSKKALSAITPSLPLTNFAKKSLAELIVLLSLPAMIAKSLLLKLDTKVDMSFSTSMAA